MGVSENTRENNYDLLRIISTCAVIMIHANWSYFGSKYNYPELSLTWVIESTLNIILRFSVPCFVMMSGAFNIKRARGIEFYKHVSWKIWIPTVIIGMILICVQIIINVLFNNNPLAGIRLTSIIAAGPYDFWYVYMQMALYLITPLILIIKRNISNQQYIILALVWGGWSLISQATSTYKLSYSLGVVHAYLGYYMIGDVIHDCVENVENIDKLKIRIVCIFVSIICFAIVFICRFTGYNFYIRGVYLNYFSPCVFLYSIAVFTFFSIMDIKNSLAWCSRRTFYTYLLHSIFLIYLKKLLNMLQITYNGLILSEIILILFSSIIVFLISFGASLVFDKFLNWISVRLNLEDKWINAKFWRFLK